jgi:hypothetical protein
MRLLSVSITRVWARYRAGQPTFNTEWTEGQSYSNSIARHGLRLQNVVDRQRVIVHRLHNNAPASRLQYNSAGLRAIIVRLAAR